MSEPLLNVMKVMLLAGLYLFFVRVLWSVYNELRDPRTRVGSGPEVGPAFTDPASPHATLRRPLQPQASRPLSGEIVRGAVAAPPSIVVGQLVMLEPDAQAGLTWALGNEITLGRSATCGVRIDDTFISGIHARIFNRNGSFFAEDLDSRNGTLHNGSPLPSATATPLQPGDRLQFGATVLEFS